MNRVAAAAILFAIIAGPPLLAAAWFLRHPWQPPRPDQLQAWTNQPLTAGTIIAGCVAAAAGGWLLLVWQAIRRARHHLVRSWRRLRRLPLPTPAQMTASSMAGVAALTFPHTDTSPTGAPPSPETTTDHTDPQQPSPPGIALPGGGWIPYPTALAVSAAIALIWQRSRHHYQPDRARIGTHHNDPDLQPLPATAAAITARLTHSRTPTPPAATPLIDGTPPGLLRLEGPGATAAARGLLVTTALAVATPTNTTDVRIPISELHHVLPGVDPRHEHLTGLLTDDIMDSSGTASDQNPDEPTDTPTTPPGSRSTPPHTTLVLSATTAETTRWHVAADSTITENGATRAHRLCLLDENSAIDLLALAHRVRRPIEHHKGTTTPPRTPAEPKQASKTAGRLTLLGTCQLTVAGDPVKLRRTAGLQILAYLATHPDGATRTELTHAIWPELPPATIGQRLHTTLADLRKQLRPLLDDSPVIRIEHRYLLNHNAISTDLQDLWAAARVSSVTQPGSSPRPPQELAAGWTWPWLAIAREALHRDFMDANSAPTDGPSAQPHL